MIRPTAMILTAVLLAFTGPVWSLPNPPTEPSEGRVLGGHRFIPSEAIPGPFVTTDFQTQTGLGFASFNVGGTDYSLGLLAQFMRFQVAATPWLALRMGIDGQALSGVNTDAALVFGASAGYDLTAGASVSWLLDRMRVSGSFDLLSSQSSRFDVYDALKDSITAGKIDASTLLINTKTTTFAPGAQVAYGFNPMLGAFGHARLALVNGTEGKGDAGSTNLSLGAGLSLDLAPISRFPVGLLVGYNLEFANPSRAGADRISTSTVSGGVFYTGRPDMALGLEGSASLSSMGTINFNTYTANFGIHYFW